MVHVAIDIYVLVKSTEECKYIIKIISLPCQCFCCTNHFICQMFHAIIVILGDFLDSVQPRDSTFKRFEQSLCYSQTLM